MQHCSSAQHGSASSLWLTLLTAAVQGKRIIYPYVALPTATEGKEKRNIRGTVALCTVTESDPINQKGGSSYPICPKQVGSSGDECTNRGRTCMVPVTQHQLEACGWCHWCLQQVHAGGPDFQQVPERQGTCELLKCNLLWKGQTLSNETSSGECS